MHFMAQTIEQELLMAIEYDDVTAFDALMERTQCGSCRLGRFPVLSLLYLYNSRKIISAYEQEFIQISDWKALGEPVAVVQQFAEKAGKCLRLYFNRVVSPLEMLLILDKTKKLKKVFPLAEPSEAVKARLKSIYYIKYSLAIKYEGDNIILERKAITRRQKYKIIAAAAGCALVVALAVAVPIATVEYVRNHAWDVTSLSQIDFSSKRTYILQNDITIPKNYSQSKVNCTIKGGGHTLVFGENVSLGEFGGKMSDVVIRTSGSPIFTVCTKNAQISNVTVNVTSDVKTDEGTAFVALTNLGTFDGVTVNVSGTMSALAGDSDGTETLAFGGMILTNDYNQSDSVYGTVKNCSVNYSDFSLDGETKANASFGGIVGVNNGIVRDCTVGGKITADTFDVAGACYSNRNLLTGIVNKARLLQSSDDDGWSPIVCGIVTENIAAVEYCQNSGALAATGQELVICGGIAANSYGQINYCFSNGEIVVTAQTAYAGGIFGVAEVQIAGYYVYFGTANSCISQAKIDASLGDGASCVGGICGLVREMAGWGGGVTNSFFTGSKIGTFNYFGNIVGVCGVGVYERNSYTSGNTQYYNFAGNYYIQNGQQSFGATAASQDEFVRVEGKGSTPATQSEIQNNQTYKDILQKLGL